MDHKFITSNKFFNAVKKTVNLYKNIWRECTTALIHGPRTADKSEKALDIALDLARNGREVLYVNAADRLDRFAGSGKSHEKLYMFTPEYESIDDKTDYADLVFEAIEQAVRTTQIRTFVIDSVSRIAALSFGRNASVAYIMKRIVALQVKCKLSVLVVADDSTKTVNNALLSLAAAEITVEDEINTHQTVGSRSIATAEPSENNAENPAVATAEKQSEPSTAPIKSEISDFCKSLTLTAEPLSRAERRRAEKLARKLARYTGPEPIYEQWS